MAAAAGKKSTTSLSMFMEAYGLEMEEEPSTVATQYWAGVVWTGKWSHELKEAWMRKIHEVQTWKQVRGPAGAVMCETRDHGIEWPYWHTLIFGKDTKIDMICVCPKDVKKMLVQTVRSVCWKKWAAKHEYEQLKEGAWLKPGLALLRKKVRENWTKKHRNVARKILLEGGRRRDCSILIGRTPVNVKPASERKDQKSTGFATAQNGTESDERF